MKPFRNLVIFGLTIASAQGAIAISPESQTNGTSTLNHTYVPSTTDLINGKTPSATSLGGGSFSQSFTGGVAVLTNGEFLPITRGPITTAPNHDGEPFKPEQFAAVGTAGGGGNQDALGGASVTYSFATAVNISAIDVYSGWQDNGRDQQRYRIFYTTTTNPLFVELSGGDYGTAGINYNPALANSGFPRASKVSITDTSGNLIENVTSIRFDFGPTENGWAGIAEIDVLGTVIPEPSSAALIGLGLMGLAGLRRRAAKP